MTDFNTLYPTPAGYINLSQLQLYIQQVIPLVYDDSISAIETLGKTLEYINQLVANCDFMEQQILGNKADIDVLKKDVATMQKKLEAFINGEYTDLYIMSLVNWIDNNLQRLVERIVKYIFFGLSADGYFMAYIPESWDFIQFDTVMNSTDPLYGHLVVKW